MTIAPALAQDQIGQDDGQPAAQPPYDALLVSPGQTAVLIEAGLIEKIDPCRLKNWDLLTRQRQDAFGPT